MTHATVGKNMQSINLDLLFLATTALASLEIVSRVCSPCNSTQGTTPD